MKPVDSMNSSGRIIEFFKIANHMMFTEIRPVKCSYIAKKGQTELKTTKWMELEHWQELEKIMEEILKEYKESDFLFGTKKVQHNVFRDKIGESIKIGYIYQPYKSCGCHIVTPRGDISESDSENDDSHSLKDKGGRFNKFRFCEDSLVVSVCPIIGANKITRYQLSKHSNSPQRMNIKLKKALKLHNSKDQNSLVSEYFISQDSNATVTKSHMGSNKLSSFRRNVSHKNSSPETLLSTNSYGNNLVVPKTISLFDTDDTSSNSFNSQKLSCSRDKTMFNLISVVQLKETIERVSGKDQVDAQKEYSNIDFSTKHSLRRKTRISYEDCDSDNPVEYDDFPDFFKKVKLNKRGTVRKNVKNEHFNDNRYEENSHLPSGVENVNEKSVSSVKTKKDMKKIKAEIDLENQGVSTVLSGKLYPDKLNKKSIKKSPLDYDSSNVSSISTDIQSDHSGDKEMTLVALTKLPHSKISKCARKKKINVQPSKPISKLSRARMISIFGHDSPDQLFKENDDEFFATGSLDNKFEGFEMDKKDISLHSNHVKQNKKFKNDFLDQCSDSSKYCSNVVMPLAGINEKLKNDLAGKRSNGDLDHCSQRCGKSKLKNNKKKFETPKKEYSKDTLYYKKKYKLSVTSNMPSKDPNYNNENVVISDNNKLLKKYDFEDNKTNSRDAPSVNIQNKTKLSRNKKNIVKVLCVDQIKGSQGDDLNDFINYDTTTSKKTFSKKIIETMEKYKTSLITKRTRGRPKKVVSELAVNNKCRQSIDLFEDSDSLFCNGSSSSNAAPTDNGYSKFSSVTRSYAKRSNQIFCNISDKPTVATENSTISSEDESDDDVNYIKNYSYLNKSSPLKCSEILASTNTNCSWQDDSYDLPNLELTQACSNSSCNKEMIPKPSNIFEDADTIKIVATTGTMTSESEEFLPTVTNYFSNLSLDDLLEKFQKNLDYLWSIAHQDIYTSRNKDFQTPNVRRPDPSYFMCLYDSQVYSKLCDAIIKEFGKFSTSHGHGDGSAFAYFVIIPELLKKLLSDWTARHLSNEKFLTDQECENMFYEIALNAPDPPESYTFKF